MSAALISPMFTWNWEITCYTTSKRKLITLNLLFINCGVVDLPAPWHASLVLELKPYISQIVDLLSSIYCYFNRCVCDDMGTWALIYLFLKAAIHLWKRVFWHRNSVTTDKNLAFWHGKSLARLLMKLNAFVCVAAANLCNVPILSIYSFNNDLKLF